MRGQRWLVVALLVAALATSSLVDRVYLAARRAVSPLANSGTQVVLTADYYGLANGAQWYYRAHLLFDGQQEDVVASVFVSEALGAGQASHERTYYLNWRVNGQDVGTDTLRLTDDEIHARLDASAGPVWVPLLQGPVEPGEVWTWQEDGQSLQGRVLREEALTVLAGQFTTTVVEHIQTDAAGSQHTSTRWLTPGVGIVRFVRPYARNQQLGQLVGELSQVRYTRG
ncbi:MAG: hypothetical protein CL878_01845 [Dehalococcoidia bacterium]|nr:hypothetical protein [Dehalococcoidia bacterium]